ncbi:MAG: SDR family oxidoreductase [Planctomycetes bacterium]|nr:SDR family oxidoreductase [Planctomycetota bacterium]
MSPLDVTAPNLIVGCGYLGRRVAALWRANGTRVAALTRGRADALRAAGIEPTTGDVLDRDSLRALPSAATVLYAVGMDRAAGRSMRDVYVNGLANVLDVLPACARFVYVSSTSVYGQTADEWVDEASATEPTEESGKVVLEAERSLRARLPGAIILRFAGIYGPDRLLRKAPVLKGEPLVGDAEKWLNLIHVADGASAVVYAEAHAATGETYNVSDGAPVSRRDFYTRLAQLLGTEAKFEPRAEPGAPNRRIDSSRFRALGWTPAHASYHDGLALAVRESGV